MSRLKKEICATIDSIRWHKQKRKKADNCFITCAGKTDGPGAQVQAVLSTMLFANELGIKYVHTPFKKIAHPSQGINDAEFYESRWESFVNLGFNELTVDQINSNELDIIHVSNLREIKKTKNTLYVISHCHKFADRNPHLYLKLIPQIQNKYSISTKKSILYFDASKINIAIHLRRGEVTKERYSKRYTDNNFVMNIIQDISTLLNNKKQNLTFHIFTNGDKEDFFDHPNIVFHQNECPFTAFHHMVSADVLIMAKSSFSYCAALFSKGTILYLPFWNKPLKNWIVVNKNGGFNKKKFHKNMP